jgi:hypothetical protein
MIQIRCGSCGHTTGASDKYAGKKVLCPKCKAVIKVPQAGIQAAAKKPDIIKFRCPHCNQKIGLSPKYAGRQVRCAKCKNTLKVPKTASASKPLSLPKKAAEDFNSFDNILDFDKLRQAEQNAPAADIPLQLTPSSKPDQQSEFADISGRIPTSSLESAGSRSGSKSFQIDNTPIALLASVVFVIIGGMVWGLIAKYAHMELGLLAWGIGVLAGLGIYLFTASRGVLLGIATAMIAFFGILSGKYFIAKWYFMPKLMAELKKKDVSGYIDPNKFELSKEKVRQIMSDPGQMYALVAMQLADDGQITKEDAEYYTTGKLAGVFRKTNGEDRVEPIEAQRQLNDQRRKDVEAKVYKCLAEWDDQRKAGVVRTQYPKMVKEFAAIFAKSRIMNVVGFAVAYIATFSLFDLLWFPIAMVTAYKFGTGENS